MSQCHIQSEHCFSTSFSTRFLKTIHLAIYFHEHKVQYHHRIQTQTTHEEWVITFLNKIWINKDISKIHCGNIYHITKLNIIHVNSPLYHLKFIFQTLITLHMNHTLESNCNNTHQFHNKSILLFIIFLYI